MRTLWAAIGIIACLGMSGCADYYQPAPGGPKMSGTAARIRCIQAWQRTAAGRRQADAALWGGVAGGAVAGIAAGADPPMTESEFAAACMRSEGWVHRD